MIIPGQVLPKAQGPHAPQLNTSIVKSGLAKVLATARKAPVTPCDCDLQIYQDGQSPPFMSRDKDQFEFNQLEINQFGSI